MSYYRRGLGALGACEMVYDLQNPTGRCKYASEMPGYTGFPTVPSSPSPTSPSSSSSGGGLNVGSLLDSFLKGFGTQPSQQQPVVMQSQTPSWLLPAAIGGVGLVALLLLRR